MSPLDRDQIFEKTNSEKFAASASQLIWNPFLVDRQKVGSGGHQLFPSPWFGFDRQASQWPAVNMLFFSLKGRDHKKILAPKLVGPKILSTAKYMCWNFLIQKHSALKFKTVNFGTTKSQCVKFKIKAICQEFLLHLLSELFWLIFVTDAAADVREL